MPANADLQIDSDTRNTIKVIYLSFSPFLHSLTHRTHTVLISLKEYGPALIKKNEDLLRETTILRNKIKVINNTSYLLIYSSYDGGITIVSNCVVNKISHQKLIPVVLKN